MTKKNIEMCAILMKAKKNYMVKQNLCATANIYAMCMTPSFWALENKFTEFANNE